VSRVQLQLVGQPRLELHRFSYSFPVGFVNRMSLDEKSVVRIE
jgi:hypothetical protein